MNILHINTLDNRGGAGRVLWRLTNELRRQGHGVSVFVGYKKSNDPNIHEIPRNPFYYRLSKFFANDLRFSRSNWILRTPEYKKADIIHCHNIHSGFFNLNTLKSISKEKPVVWTLQDLWPITSGCTDSYHCKVEKPRRLCGILRDNRKYLLEQKRQVYEDSRFTTVSSSVWMAKKIKTSILGHLPHYLIHNGIDISIFTPYNKHNTRKELGLPIDKKIILFIATKGIDDHLKGADYIEKIAHFYRDDEKKLFVAIGGDKAKMTNSQKIKGNIFQTGYINDEKMLAKYYSAADFFIYPSRADNSPLVVTESMACGTPVISFKIDGIPEMVSDCGFLARSEDWDDLKNKTEKMLSISPEYYEKISSMGITRVRQYYSLEKMTDEYLSLYSKTIEAFISETQLR